MQDTRIQWGDIITNFKIHGADDIPRLKEASREVWRKHIQGQWTKPITDEFFETVFQSLQVISFTLLDKFEDSEGL